MTMPETNDQTMSGKKASTVGSLHAAVQMLEVERRFRHAESVEELAHILISNIGQLVAFDHGVVWAARETKGQVLAVSGLAEPVISAPFTLWVRDLCASKAKEISQKPDTSPVIVSRNDCPRVLRSTWDEFFSAHAVFVPLSSQSGQFFGFLVLARQSEWLENELRILTRVGEAAVYSFDALLVKGKRKWGVPKGIPKKFAAVVIIVVFFALFIPVRLTVLAPAEVTPVSPIAVRAPIDAVIKTLAVEPNQAVNLGDVLLTLDDTELRARLDVAARELDIAIAEKQLAQQTLIRDQQASSRLSVLSSRVDQAEADVNYLTLLLGRVTVRAERTGIAIISNPDELVGRPVRLGERILTVADPDAVKVTAWLVVEDYVPLEIGAPPK